MLQSRLQIPSNNLLAVVLLYMLASNLLLLLWATTQNGVAASNGAGAIEVADFGPIKKIIAPPGWTKSDHSDAIKIALELEPKTQREVRIGLLSWRRGISEQSWAYFKALIIANSNLNSSRLLFTDKGLPDAKAIENVKALTRVLGINHAGDNQITNSRKPPDPQAPVFHLERLELQSLNGKTVLFARGYFINIHGKPTTFSSGVFARHQRDKVNEVYQVYLQAPDKASLQRNRQIFENTLKSIQWTE